MLIYLHAHALLVGLCCLSRINWNLVKLFINFFLISRELVIIGDTNQHNTRMQSKHKTHRHAETTCIMQEQIAAGEAVRSRTGCAASSRSDDEREA